MIILKLFQHAALGIIGFFAIAALGFGWIHALVFALASFAIDIDHLAWYVWHFKKLDFLNAKKKFESHEFRDLPVLKIFHTIEFWLFTLVLSFIGTAWFFLFLGISFHLIIDFAQVQLFCRKECRMAKRSWSIAGFLIKSKKGWKTTE